MNLKHLLNLEDISIRPYNVCRGNDINSVNDLINYYQNHGTFLTLKKCGQKSNQELIELAERYMNLEQKHSFDPEIEIVNLSMLSRTQRQIVNDFIVINLEYISARSRNALNILMENNICVSKMYEKIFDSHSFEIANMRNVGSGTQVEIQSFVTSTKIFIQQVSTRNKEEDLIHLKTIYFLRKTFDLKEIPDFVIESQSAFVLVHFLMKSNVFFKENRQFLIDSLFQLEMDSKVKTIDAISKATNYTPERIRQLRQEILDDISKKLSVLTVFGEKFLYNYEIDTRQAYIYLSHSAIDHINSISKTNFSKSFITYIISKTLFGTHTLIGNVEDVLWFRSSKINTRYKWKSIYLVATELAHKENVEILLNDIYKRQNERIEESYHFNFNSYLSRFIECSDEDLSFISSFCEKIINEELSLYLDLEDNIVFERNTLRSLPELVIEILDELGKPSKLDVIYPALIKKYPNSTKSRNSLRGSINSSDSIIYFGRSSTYGLQKWETESDAIKGGTIKDMVTGYLQTHSNRPVHIYEIFVYVSKYRSTKPINISSNLEIDPAKSFKFYMCGFIGLKSLKANYNEAKYDALPKHLTKKLVGMIQKFRIRNKTEWVEYLEADYKLNAEESLNMLSMLKFRNKNITI